MQRYFLQRMLGIVPIVLIVGAVAFLLVQLTPGDAASFFAAPDATEADLELIRARLGLDQPLAVQFVYWFGGVIRGDLGLSFFSGRPVTELYFRALPATLMLALCALLVGLVIAVPLGVMAALRRNTWIDSLLTTVVLIGVSLPHFWFGMMLILLFAVHLGWFPSQGFVRPGDGFGASLRTVALPALALGYSSAALIARMVRSSMLDVLGQDFIRTARAKGVHGSVIVWKHALLNAANPILTVVGLTVSALVSGAIVIESVFNFPGIGRLVVTAIQRQDYPLVQGSLLLTAGLIIVVNLTVDLLYAAFDPRIRFE